MKKESAEDIESVRHLIDIIGINLGLSCRIKAVATLLHNSDREESLETIFNLVMEKDWFQATRDAARFLPKKIRLLKITGILNAITKEHHTQTRQGQLSEAKELALAFPKRKRKEELTKIILLQISLGYLNDARATVSLL